MKINVLLRLPRHLRQEKAPRRSSTVMTASNRSWTWLAAAILLAVWPVALPAFAEVRLPHVFGDNMVLQRGMPVPMWGWAANGEGVTVTIADQARSAKAGDDGRWKVTFPALEAGGPFSVTIKGTSGTTCVLHNVLVGEVWLAAGQSNMEKPIGPHPGQKPCPNWEQELAAANYPALRLLEVPPRRSAEPARDADCRWLVCTPTNIVVKRGGGRGYSACAYFFGRELHRQLKVPVGLIAASVSGSRCEPWTPGDETGKKGPVCYNGLIHPIVPFAIRGVIWYQGESNVGDGMKYCDKMKALIGGWRRAWGQGDFPFLFVQLPPYRRGGGVRLPELREAQAACLSLPNTGMAVTLDVGSYPDCHCPNKQAVGKRLALWALAKTYGRKDVVCSGPLFQAMRADGGKIRIRFEHTGSGLATRDGAEGLTCFEIAGTDGTFVPATARIDDDGVVVWSDAVPRPSKVRFAWNEQAVPNLMNKEGLPAAPFRTDAPPR